MDNKEIEQALKDAKLYIEDARKHYKKDKGAIAAAFLNGAQSRIAEVQTELQMRQTSHE